MSVEPSANINWEAICTQHELTISGLTVAAPGAALRCVSAHEAMLRVEPYLHDFGITRVANVTRLDRVGIPVHTAHKPTGTSLSNGSGKGVEEESSRIGAIMEAVEQTYWEECEIPRIKASSDDLDADGIAHVDALQIPMNQANLYNDRFVIEWTPMTDVATGDEVLVPADVVGLPFRLTHKRSAATHMCSSNGLASGNNVVEALLSGLSEVMERDALAMKAAETGLQIPLESIAIEPLREWLGEPFTSLVDKIEAADLGLSVFDRTGEAGLPTYKCLIWERSGGGAGLFGGYGANLNAKTAIVRAVTEAAQARCLIIAGARDDQFRCGRDASRLISRQQVGEHGVASEEPIIYPDRSTGSLASDNELLAELLASQGTGQILFHRYTEPSDPAQVIRVLVPGLEGYQFANYMPGPRAEVAIKNRMAVSA